MKSKISFFLIFSVLVSLILGCKKEIEPPLAFEADSIIWIGATPKEGASNADVFSNIVLEANVNLNTPNKDNTWLYKLVVDDFQVIADSSNIPGEFVVIEKRIVFTPKTILPFNTKLTIKVRSHYEVKKGDTYVYLEKNGQKVERNYEYSISTVNLDFSNIISETDPLLSTSGISLYQSLKLTFRYPKDKELRFDWTQKALKMVIDSFCVINGGEQVNCKYLFEKENQFLTLSPQKTWVPGVIEVKLKYHWEYKVSSVWTVLPINISDPYTCKFNLIEGAELDTLNSEYIDYLYPIPNQCYLLKDEYSKGYMKLRFPVKGIFNTEKYTYLVQFKSKDEQDAVPATYNESTMTFEFPLSNIVKNSTIYSISFIKMEKQGTEMVEFYKYHFRTSMYNTLKEKIDASFPKGFWSWPTGINMFTINSTISAKEYFDKAEAKIDSNGSVKALAGLVRIKYTEIPNVYQDVCNRMYTNPLSVTLTRDKEPFGAPPVNAFSIDQLVYDELATSNITSNSFISTNDKARYADNFLILLTYDFKDLKNKLQNKTETTSNDKLVLSYNWQFWAAPSVNRYVAFSYVLPGNVVTSSFDKIFLYQ